MVISPTRQKLSEQYLHQTKHDLPNNTNPSYEEGPREESTSLDARRVASQLRHSERPISKHDPNQFLFLPDPRDEAPILPSDLAKVAPCPLLYFLLLTKKFCSTFRPSSRLLRPR